DLGHYLADGVPRIPLAPDLADPAPGFIRTPIQLTGEILLNRPGEILRILRGGEKAGDTLDNLRLERAHAGGDHRHAEAKGQGQRTALIDGSVGKHEQVGSPEKNRDLSIGNEAVPDQHPRATGSLAETGS